MMRLSPFKDCLLDVRRKEGEAQDIAVIGGYGAALIIGSPRSRESMAWPSAAPRQDDRQQQRVCLGCTINGHGGNYPIFCGDSSDLIDGGSGNDIIDTAQQRTCCHLRLMSARLPQNVFDPTENRASPRSFSLW